MVKYWNWPCLTLLLKLIFPSLSNFSTPNFSNQNFNVRKFFLLPEILLEFLLGRSPDPHCALKKNIQRTFSNFQIQHSTATIRRASPRRPPLHGLLLASSLPCFSTSVQLFSFTPNFSQSYGSPPLFLLHHFSHIIQFRFLFELLQILSSSFSMSPPLHVSYTSSFQIFIFRSPSSQASPCASLPPSSHSCLPSPIDFYFLFP